MSATIEAIANAAAAAEAATLWHEATQAPPSGYFISKGLTCTHGARWHEHLQCWLVPVIAVSGELCNLQLIFNNGSNRYLKGDRIIPGCFVLLGQLDINTPYIQLMYGFATGAALREATGDVVACAMNAGNVSDVFTAIRGVYPKISISSIYPEELEFSLDVQDTHGLMFGQYHDDEDNASQCLDKGEPILNNEETIARQYDDAFQGYGIQCEKKEAGR